MIALFKPAAVLMSRLKYPQKFMLIGLLLLLPLGLVLVQLIWQLNKDIDFAAYEQIGLRYILPLDDVLQSVQQYAALQTSVISGEDEFEEQLADQEALVEAAIAAVDVVDARYNRLLQVGEQWTAIKQGWPSLRDNMDGRPEDIVATHERYSTQIRSLITSIGNSSNLILDPNVDSYYLMDAVVTKLPQLSDYLSQIRNLGTRITIARRVSTEQRIQLTILSGLVQSTVAANTTGLGYTYEQNPAMKLLVDPDLTAMTTEIDTFLELLNAEITSRLNGLVITSEWIPTPAFYREATKATDSVFTLNLPAADALDGLLQERIDALVVRRTAAIIFTVVALSATIYLFVGFYLSVQNTIASLDRASQRMVSGQLAGAVKLESRDELAQVAISFNKIAGELITARDRALEASRAKSTFLANMSHELRTPLNAIMGYSELITEELQERGEEEFVPDLKKIQTAAEHLLSLINDILDLSKIEAGKMELHLEHIELSRMIDGVVATVMPMIEKNGNRLDIQTTPSLGSAFSDLTKIRQILFNLLSNASKFTEKGTIRLDARRETIDAQEWIRFTVTDSGIGMNDEQIGRLFQEFTQADSSTTRKYGGTGLGLTISRRFCQMLGGDIEVRSQPGNGAIFTVRVLADMPRPVLPIKVEPSITPIVTSPGTSTVLVIDDDESVRELVTRFLTKEGFNVQTASNGMEGIRLAHSLRPDVITLDVMMPGMDGWAVISALKADPDVAHIPVVMMTIISDMNLGYSLGASDYLTKPIDRDRLLNIMRKYDCATSICKIMVVEDDAQTREIISRMLEKEGWQVNQAEDGLAAVESFKRDQPDIILLDLMMPRMDGFQFLNEIRATENGRSIPVIVVTAMDLSDSDKEQLNGHVKQILQKGTYKQEQLLNEVRSVVLKIIEKTDSASA